MAAVSGGCTCAVFGCIKTDRVATSVQSKAIGEEERQGLGSRTPGLSGWNVSGVLSPWAAIAPLAKAVTTDGLKRAGKLCAARDVTLV